MGGEQEERRQAAWTEAATSTTAAAGGVRASEPDPLGTVRRRHTFGSLHERQAPRSGLAAGVAVDEKDHDEDTL